jgi:hypothetical protein
MSFRGNVERVLAHNHGARLLGFVKPKQLICEADNRPCLLAALAPDRLWQSVIGPMSKGVAIDDQQRPGA